MPKIKTTYYGSSPLFINQFSMLFAGAQSLPYVVQEYNSALTVSVWVKTTSPDSLNVLACKDIAGGTGRSWHLIWRGSSSGYRKILSTVFHPSGSFTTMYSNSTGLIDNGNWHNVIMIFNGLTLSQYINGILDISVPAVEPTIRPNPSLKTTFGTLTNNVDWRFKGNLDEMAIWNSDQTANVAAIYNGGTPPDLTSLAPNDWIRGDGGTFDGTNWNLPNVMGAETAVSFNMTAANRVNDVP